MSGTRLYRITIDDGEVYSATEAPGVNMMDALENCFRQMERQKQAGRLTDAVMIWETGSLRDYLRSRR